LRRLLHSQAGTVALEFALVGTAFIMLLLGGIQIGLLWWTENALQITAMMTARCAALNSCANPQTFAVSTARAFGIPNAITTSDVSVASSSACNGSAAGYAHFTQVTITSTMWAANLISPLSAASSLQAAACFPSPTAS
jgi:Flp pilus assembly protein TadG